MEGKKSFKLYTDMIELVNGSNVHGVEIEPMNDEEAGQLFRWILEYVNDLHPIVPKSIKYAIVQIKKILDADLESYKKQCSINQKNGALGGRPKKPKETEENQIGFGKTKANPQKADKDKDKDKDKEKKLNSINTLGRTTIENDTIRTTLFERFWNEYPKKVGKQKCKKWFMNKSRNVDEELLNQMIKALAAWKKSDQWKDEQYIPNPYTWLNRGGWEDELPKQEEFSSASKTKVVWDTVAYSLEEEISFFKGVQKNNTAEVLQSNLEELKERDLERYYQVKKALGI